jgi:hypothetical protein
VPNVTDSAVDFRDPLGGDSASGELGSMNWYDQWRAIDARIHALGERGHLAFASPQTVGSDFHGTVTAGIIREGKELFELLGSLESAAGDAFPEPARRCIRDFRQDFHSLLHPGAQRLGGWGGVQAVLDAFVGVGARLRFHMSDVQASIRSATERGLIHLRRSLIVDDALRDRWAIAFKRGEPALEGLGAVHLLLHGIWAFKADTKGERTDLVLGQHLVGDLLDQAQTAARGLVLTEWKRIGSAKQFAAQCDQGLLQAQRYSQGALAGVELTTVRYVILVSMDVDQNREPAEFSGTTYRFVSIQISPRVPSKSKAKLAIRKT